MVYYELIMNPSPPFVVGCPCSSPQCAERTRLFTEALGAATATAAAAIAAMTFMAAEAAARAAAAPQHGAGGANEEVEDNQEVEGNEKEGEGEGGSPPLDPWQAAIEAWKQTAVAAAPENMHWVAPHLRKDRKRKRAEDKPDE